MMDQQTMASLTKHVYRSLLLSALMSVIAVVVFAQDAAPGKPATKEQKPTAMTWKVEHDHAIGEGTGELRITESGIEFKGESKDEERHSRAWQDGDIKRLEISRDKLRVVIYEASSIPIIPRKVPFSGGGKVIRTGSEHDYVFRLRSGEITSDLVSTLLARFNRPIATSVLPDVAEQSGKLLFEIPVFHRQRAGGKTGMLQVYEHNVIFAAEDEHALRYWRYSDIRDIGNLGQYQFEIATYEKQFATDGRSYIFDLKRRMTEAEYNSFWIKVYEHGRNEHKQGDK